MNDFDFLTTLPTELILEVYHNLNSMKDILNLRLASKHLTMISVDPLFWQKRADEVGRNFGQIYYYACQRFQMRQSHNDEVGQLCPDLLKSCLITCPLIQLFSALSRNYVFPGSEDIYPLSVLSYAAGLQGNPQLYYYFLEKVGPALLKLSGVPGEYYYATTMQSLVNEKLQDKRFECISEEDNQIDREYDRLIDSTMNYIMGVTAGGHFELLNTIPVELIQYPKTKQYFQQGMAIYDFNNSKSGLPDKRKMSDMIRTPDSYWKVPSHLLVECINLHRAKICCIIESIDQKITWSNVLSKEYAAFQANERDKDWVRLYNEKYLSSLMREEITRYFNNYGINSGYKEYSDWSSCYQSPDIPERIQFDAAKRVISIPNFYYEALRHLENSEISWFKNSYSYPHTKFDSDSFDIVRRGVMYNPNNLSFFGTKITRSLIGELIPEIIYSPALLIYIMSVSSTQKKRSRLPKFVQKIIISLISLPESPSRHANLTFLFNYHLQIISDMEFDTEDIIDQLTNLSSLQDSWIDYLLKYFTE